MKTQLIVALFLSLVFTSCKKDVVETLDFTLVEDKMAAPNYNIICYQGIIKQDTINMRLQIEANQEICGDLSYIYFEKDRNIGTILGTMVGDTLKANYTFTSEGKDNEREIVFLRKGKIIIEAYGDVEEIESKTIFKDPKKLYFDSATVLSEVDCKKSK